jgi:2'-5' RNA ligase
MHLQSKISTALLQRHFPVDTRKFTPHVTLAHLKNADLIKLGDFISAYSLFETASFTVPAFHLYHSRRGSDAGRYEILSSYDLS